MRGLILVDRREFIYYFLRSVNHAKPAASNPAKTAKVDSFSPVSGNCLVDCGSGVGFWF